MASRVRASGAIPPTLPSNPPPALALGDDPGEREPIKHPFAAIEAMLRQPRRVMYQLRQPGSRPEPAFEPNLPALAKARP